ncbi:MAG TPA: lamin tail domain-containing protein, partial [Verrucomicrobiae bacterium]|nr:lamin tail domain-containing protein [Verrucomicrobiae bacterium]
MPNICSRTFQWLACLATAFLFSFAAQAQSLVPVDVGTVVNGFQDDFTGASLGAQWTPAGSSLDIYSVANGMLHVSTAGGDPNHLLCTIPGYDSSTQEVLARIRFTNFGTGDPARGGVGVAVDSGSSQGINFHFRDLGGRHASFLDDFRAWGPDTAISWQNNVWYWVRLRQDSSASQGGLFAKIWPADGTVAEPGTWQSWNYTSARAGYAGITAGSSSGISEFDVDYILIKAAGLPSITVAPAAFPLYTAGPAFLTRQPASTNVTQCSPAAFSVTADGTPPYSYQWYRNGVAIAGATNMTFNLDSAQPADDGAVFRVAVGNDVNGTPREVTSSNATLHVIADLTPPALAGAANAGGPDSILVAFTKPVTRTSATNLQNYRITSPGLVLPVVAATLASDQTNVLLTTSGQVEGVTYTLTVNGILDQCTGANVILTNSRATFTASAYAPADIGGATPAGSIVGAGGGYDLSGGGSGINGTADQFQFSYQQRSGDFDVRVRLDSLTGTDAWAEAGLMARETPASGSRFAAALATPSISGAFFRSRATASTPLTTAGSFPVNYPNTWLRLQRVGNQFNGYASLDGQSWTLLGGARMNLPGTVYFGFAVASHVSGQATTAAFRQLSAVTGATIAAPLAFEPMGQSSRLTSLVFSEVMYHPSSVLGPGGAPGNLAGASRLEFVELLNTLGTPEDIGGYQLDGDVHYTFPTGTVIPGGAFLVVARAPDDLRRVYGSGLSNVVGPYTSSFPNGAGKLQLRNQTGALFLEVDYDSQPPWPVAADGAGHSLVLARPSLGENDPR